MENSAPAAPAQQTEAPAFAPSWDTSNPPAATQRPVSFEQQFEQNADRIADDLQLDTQKLTPQEQPKQQAQPKAMKEQKSSPQDWEKKYKDLESLSGRKLRDAAQAKKNAEQALSNAQRALQIQQELEKVLATNDDDAILRALGRDPQKYADSAIERRYRESQLSPEQRAQEQLRQYQEKAEAYRQELLRQQQEHQQRQQLQQQEVATNQAAQNLSKAFMSTADQMNLPKTALTMQRFANMLSAARQAGVDPTFADLGEQVQKQYVDDVIGFLNGLTPETFAKHIPPKTQQMLRGLFLKQTGNAAAPTGTPPSGPYAPRQVKQKFTGVADYNQFLDNLRRG